MEIDLPPPVTLLGRQREVRTLGEAVTAAPRDGAVLVLRGDPGVGKSALLEHAVRQVRGAGWAVLRTDGTPGERLLPLAAVHKLLRPVLAETAGLSPTRRAILDDAFGSAERTVDVYGVALACLDLVSAVAARRPVAVVVDDAHVLDAASVDVLTFVARRVSPDPVLLLVATRSAGGDPFAEAGLPDLVLGPLDRPASEALIDAAAPDLDPGLRPAVLALAEGNPLALLELPLSLPRDPAGPARSGLIPLTGRLERAFAGRIAELPRVTRDLLLAAAVADTGSRLGLPPVEGDRSTTAGPRG